MAILVVPPVQYLADSQEVPPAIKRLGQAYLAQALSALKISNVQETISQGGFKGTQVYPWTHDFDGLLSLSLVFEKGSGFRNQWLYVAKLIDKKSCATLGAAWSLVNIKPLPFSLSSSELTINEIAQRSINSFGKPLEFKSIGYFQNKQYEFIFKAVLLESFAARNIAIKSEEYRLWCQGTYGSVLDEFSSNTKPDKTLGLKINTQQENDRKKEMLNYQAYLYSSIFGNSVPLSNYPDIVLFEPEKVVSKIVDQAFPKVSDLKKQKFKVIGREGMFVYLDKGRASGATIGLRLIGPSGTKLHIVKYAPGLNNELDASVAFIRKDTTDSIKVGDFLSIDSTNQNEG